MSQHANLDPERWKQFTLAQQIIMIGNEMHRASKLVAPADRARLQSCYERVLNLVDVTVQVNEGLSLRRELLRWREVLAGLFMAPAADPALHRLALRVLLQFTPESARQVEFVAPRS